MFDRLQYAAEWPHLRQKHWALTFTQNS